MTRQTWVPNLTALGSSCSSRHYIVTVLNVKITVSAVELQSAHGRLKEINLAIHLELKDKALLSEGPNKKSSNMVT